MTSLGCTPEPVVDFLSNNVHAKYGGWATANEDWQQGWWHELEDRVHPHLMHHSEIDDPSDIGADKHEDGAESIFSGRRGMVDKLGFKQREEWNGGVRQLVEPPWIVDCEWSRENQLSVVEVERPE